MAKFHGETDEDFSGWWFGTWIFMTFHSVGNNNPNWRTHIFQRGRYHRPVFVGASIRWPWVYAVAALVNISSTCPKCKPRPWNFIWQVWIHLTIPSMYFQIGEFRWFIWKHGSATKPNVIKCRSAKHLGKHQEILTEVRSPHRLSMWHNEGCGERCQPSGGPGKMSANYFRGGLDGIRLYWSIASGISMKLLATWPSKIIQFPECSWARDVWF